MDLEAVLHGLRALRRGDLTVRLTGDSELAREWNGLLDEFGAVADGVTRVAGEIGREGRFGGVVTVSGAPGGAWAEIVDSVNLMVATVTDQFRSIGDVTRGVARGDLSQRITVAARGEVLALKDTVNSMIDRLQELRAEVSRVSAQLETEGTLAATKDAGLWEEFNDNVSLAEHVAMTARYKSQFLANMSHELRTPLNSLLILARLLANNQDGNLTTRQVEYARTIYGAGSDLLVLINEILDLSKLEAGKMRVEASEVAIGDVEALIERDFRPVAEHHGLELVVTRDPDAPVALHTDPQRLHQVLKNLLSNALKFTERGGVTVRISRDRDERVRFAVSDTGIGIDPAEQEAIFEPFQQADGSTSRRYGGTGLGLTISRGFARLLGGELQVTSRRGAGSTFSLTIPTRLAVGPDATPSPRSAWIEPVPQPAEVVDHRTELAGRTVLVVDDDVRNIFALAGLLEAQQMKLRFAEGGQLALDELARDPHVDLVLMDIMMPDLDGYQVLRRLRQDPLFVDLPIIAVTARALTEDRQRCLDAGASDYLPKPIDPGQLLTMMCRVLRG